MLVGAISASSPHNSWIRKKWLPSEIDGLLDDACCRPQSDALFMSPIESTFPPQ